MPRLSLCVDNTGEFSGFAPYVPSINDRGVVAFQAECRDGRLGVFADGGDAGGHQVFSHPDINSRGDVCFYAGEAERAGVFLSREGVTRRVGAAPGPLGPTMNEAGDVAWRGRAEGGRAAVFLSAGGRVTLVAAAGDGVAGFEGLPVVNARGEVAYRAAFDDGGQAVFIWSPSVTRLAAQTGVGFAELSRFPSMNDAGEVAFCGVRAGVWGVFVGRTGGVEMVHESGDRFESFRGALIDNAARLVVIGTPRDAPLGIFAGDDLDPVLSVGDELLGGVVEEFALNPVSTNNAGRIAVRIRLRGGRECIASVDLVGGP